jgi:hypothetical protein
MDSLQDILKQYGTPDEPEILAVKQYVAERFNTPVSVAINGESLVITVPSAALANTLRMQTPTLKAACHTDKRLVFRIG